MREERRLWGEGYRSVAGLDEAGRGPIAGPVVAGAAIFRGEIEGPWVRLVQDSKRLTPSQRTEVLPRIAEAAASIATGSASPEEIDRLGISAAVRLAMHRAIECLSVAPDYLLLDAFPLPDSDLPQTALVRGDALCTSIAAASIAAKVERDRVMVELDRRHPGYGFARHKGYGTAEHGAAVRRLGPTEAHRITFAPVRDEAHARGVFAERLIGTSPRMA